MNFLLYEMIGNGVRQAKTVDEKIKYLIGWRRRLSNSGEEAIINKINSTLTELYEIKHKGL